MRNFKKIFLIPKIVLLVCLALAVNSLRLAASESKEMIFRDTPNGELTFPTVVFMDWGNTLAKRWPFVLEVLNETIQSFGKPPLTKEELGKLDSLNLPIERVIEEIFGGERTDVVKLYWEKYSEKAEKFPLQMDESSAELLAYLKGKGVFIAIVSNQQQPILKASVKDSGLSQYIDMVVGALPDAQNNKPMKEAVRRALRGSLWLKQLSKKTHPDWWFVGDGTTDMKTALNSDCFPVWVAENALQDIQFVNTPQQYKGKKVASLQELLTVLKQIAKN